MWSIQSRAKCTTAIRDLSPRRRKSISRVQDRRHLLLGPEAEFFIFDHARYDQTNHSAYYHIDSDEGVWNMGQEGVNLGGKIRHKEGYFPVAPTDTQQDIRTEMIWKWKKRASPPKSITTKWRRRGRRKSIFASIAC